MEVGGSVFHGVQDLVGLLPHVESPLVRLQEREVLMEDVPARGPGAVRAEALESAGSPTLAEGVVQTGLPWNTGNTITVRWWARVDHRVQEEQVLVQGTLAWALLHGPPRLRRWSKRRRQPKFAISSRWQV